MFKNSPQVIALCQVKYLKNSKYKEEQLNIIEEMIALSPNQEKNNLKDLEGDELGINKMIDILGEKLVMSCPSFYTPLERNDTIILMGSLE